MIFGMTASQMQRAPEPDSKEVPSGRVTTSPARDRPATVPEVSLGQRHATLRLSPCRRPAGSRESGPAYGAHLEHSAFSVWRDDATTLAVIAYVLNIGTVRLQLPALPDRTPRVQALGHDLPPEVIALSSGVSRSLPARQRAQAEAQFVRRFTAGLRVCFGAAQEAPAVVDWYRQKLLPEALKAVPAELRVNTTLQTGSHRA
jgi:hypothetical protein